MSALNGDALPRGWVIARSNDCADIQLGKMLDKAKRTKGVRLPYLRNANVRWETFDLSELFEMPFEETELERYGLQPDDVIICEGGEPGRAAVWKLKNSEIKFQKALHRARMHGGIDPRWLVYSLYFDATRGTLAPAFTGTTINHLPLVALKKYEIRIPPLLEQARILPVLEALFSKLDAAVGALERARANLKRYRASVLKAAVEGRLVQTEAELARKEGRDFEPASVLLDRILAERRRRWEESELARMKAADNPPKDHRWRSNYKEPAALDARELPELPEGWAYTTLPRIVLPSGEGMKTGPFGTLLQKHEHRKTGVPVIGIENIEPLRFVPGTKIHIAEEKAADLGSYDVRSGDLVVSRSGTVGEVCVIPDNIGTARFSTNVMRVRFVSGSPIPEFVAVLLNGSPFVLSQVSDLCRGTTRDFLNQRILGAIAFPIPPLAEQRRILAEVDRCRSLIQAVEDNLAASETRCSRLRQSILKWAFEGKLVDQDPNDEPASVLLERIRAERAAATPSRKSRKPMTHETEAAK